MDGALLSRLGEDDADPFASPCRMGLRLERELGELVWELPTVGLGAPSFFIRACCGLGVRECLGSSSGSTNHLEHHALLRAVVAGPDPLELAFWG